MEQERKTLDEQKARLRREQQELVELDLIQRRKLEEDEKLQKRLARRQKISDPFHDHKSLRASQIALAESKNQYDDTVEAIRAERLINHQRVFDANLDRLSYEFRQELQDIKSSIIQQDSIFKDQFH